MKKILTVYTGGTIGTAPVEGKRTLSAGAAKRALSVNFAESDSEYARLGEELFEDSDIDAAYRTLSENMTIPKLSRIIGHIKSFNLNDFAGVIVLHGTDALAYTAAFLSFVLADTPVPVMLVSGNHPPMDPRTNANANFRCAAELILQGIAPGVYVPYRNVDGDLRLHMASSLMQCANFSEDFFSAVPERKASLRDGFGKALA
ncbi:MAG: asparaginase, partial [Clostridia bacterium]|nr:asparaginase [Clostridia bacterium]